ncbi:MAG: hypothetical protein SFU98_15630 [Leptospiraceae bacterium]|nr:hypothetical protein [Leptospiraceae bacterium]
MFSYIILFCILLAIAIGFSLYQSKKENNTRGIFFYSSFVYLVLGALFIPTWFFYVGAVSILLGIAFFFLDKLKLNPFIQILAVLIPVAGLVSVLILETPSKNIFLIPKDFRGRVLIVHGCKNGVEEETEDGYRLYQIPPNGILKTKFKFKGNSFDGLNSQFFFIDESGKREPIDYQDHPGSELKNKIYVQGLWSLPLERGKKETPFDFIVDSGMENNYNYQSEKNSFYQKEYDSCYE